MGKSDKELLELPHCPSSTACYQWGDVGSHVMGLLSNPLSWAGQSFSVSPAERCWAKCAMRGSVIATEKLQAGEWFLARCGGVPAAGCSTQYERRGSATETNRGGNTDVSVGRDEVQWKKQNITRSVVQSEILALFSAADQSDFNGVRILPRG